MPDRDDDDQNGDGEYETLFERGARPSSAPISERRLSKITVLLNLLYSEAEEQTELMREQTRLLRELKSQQPENPDRD